MPMLQKLRDKTSGWIATAVLGLLIIPFAFLGVNEYVGGGPDSAVAKVEAPPSWWQSAPGWWPLSMLWEHGEVTSEEFRAGFEQARQQKVPARLHVPREIGGQADQRPGQDIGNDQVIRPARRQQRMLHSVRHQHGQLARPRAQRHAIGGSVILHHADADRIDVARRG